MYSVKKSHVVTSSLGLKISKPSLSLGIKQSHNPHLDSDTLTRNNTSEGIINNESKSNDSQYQPIKGVHLPNYKSNINSNRNNI